MHIVYLMLFLFGINVFGEGQVVLLLLLAYIVFNKQSLRFHTDFFLLLLFSAVYCFVNYLNGDDPHITTFLIPVAFLIGYNLLDTDDRRTLIRVILCIALSMAIHGFLTLFYEIIRFGALPSGGIHYDVWTRSVTSITGTMVNYTMLSVFAGYALFGKGRVKWLWLPIAVALLHSILVGGRAYIFFIAISLAVGIAAYLIWAPEHKWIRVVTVSAVLVVIGLTLILMYQNNLLRIRTVFESSYLYHRLFSPYAQQHQASMFSTGRWTQKLSYLELMTQYLWGGGHIHEITGSYAHDLWLEIHDRGGIIPFVLIVVFTVRMIVRMYRLIAHKKDDWGVKLVLTCYVVVALAQLFEEPVYQGSPLFLLSVIMIDGMVSKNLSTSDFETE